jgi:hypothetical protein
MALGETPVFPGLRFKNRFAALFHIGKKMMGDRY